MIIPRTGSKDDFPLVLASCNYSIVDVQASITVKQLYVSTTESTQQVSYVFPLPVDAAVCSFKAILDGKKVIKGVVKEKREAKRVFDGAVAKGKTVALLEKHHADVFQVSLGNMNHKQTIAIHIVFVLLISHTATTDKSLRVQIPTTIAPRYGTPPAALPPDWAEPSEHRLQVTLSIQMLDTITSITSPSHPIKVTLGSPAQVALAQHAFLGDDIIIIINSGKLGIPRCFVDYDPDHCTAAYGLSLIPRFDLPHLSHQEYIFLVDCSGSMAGTRIKTVRYALQVMLSSLPTENTLFNIMRFGTEYKSLWLRSSVYSADTRNLAAREIDNMDATYGGTETNKALRATFAILNNKYVEGVPYPTSIFLLTDGETWDLDRVLETVGNAMERAKEEGRLLRIFVLGIGETVSTPLCEGIARAGHGICMLVRNTSTSVEKLLKLVAAARSRRVEDLEVDWDDEPDQPVSQEEAELISLGGDRDAVVSLAPPPRIQQAPVSSKIPIPLYPGFRCSVFAIIKQQRDGASIGFRPRVVRLRGKIDGRPIVVEIPTELAPRFHNSINGIHVLAARALIQAFEDQPRTDERDAEIIRLAKRFSLATSQTSFIAVAEKTVAPKPFIKHTGQPAPVGTPQNKSSVQERNYSTTKKARTRPDTGLPFHNLPADNSSHTRVTRVTSPSPIPSSHATSPAASTSPPMMLSRPRTPLTTTVVVTSVSPSSPLLPAAFIQSRPESLISVSTFETPGSPAASYFMVSPRSPSPPIIINYADVEEEEVEVFEAISFEELDPDENEHEFTDAVVHSAATSRSLIEPLARIQSFDGSFEPSSHLWSIILNGSSITSSSQKLSQPAALSSLRFADEFGKTTIWCTLLTVAFLDKQCSSPEERETWSLMAEKAIDFVRKFLVEVERVDRSSAERLIYQLQAEASNALY